MKRQNEQTLYILAGLAPILAAGVWLLVREVSRRRTGDGDLDRLQTSSFEQLASTYPREQVRGTPPHLRQGAMVFPVPPRATDRPVAEGEKEQRGSIPWLAILIALLILGVAVFFLLQGRIPVRAQVEPVTGGNPENGRQALQSWGCGSCHTIPGVAGANGKVGPQLVQMAEQTFIAGMLPNTPENLMQWIMNPQDIQPGNAMPDTGVLEAMARDMAAYLYSIR